MMRFFKLALIGLVLLIAAAIVGVAVFPPDLFRVGSNYSAKIVCSNVFLAGRDPDEVLKVDVQAPGHPMLSLMRVHVDKEARTVEAGLLGFIGKGLSVYREGQGCAPVPDGRLDLVASTPSPVSVDAPRPDWEWPVGQAVTSESLSSLETVLADDSLVGPGIRAVVVVHKGKIIAERYEGGFGPQTPMLGWSMAKTVTAALVGRLIQEKRVDLDNAQLFDHWGGDNRAKIRLQDLLGMASDLDWNEGYGTVSDVTRMLFLEPDMAALASGPGLTEPDGSQIGRNFSYSSGTSVVISRYLQNLHDDPKVGLQMPEELLFAPLGMSSAVIEADARGTLVAGSFMYASPRDWARVGQFLLQKGIWQGQQLLPPGYFDWMVEPHPSRESGSYGRGHIWLKPPRSRRSDGDPEFAHTAYWLAGHDGQSIAILPQQQLVIVRLGLTPSKLNYKPAPLAEAVISALR